MNIYRPSELKRFLQSIGVRPDKKLSQNFLIDGNIIRKIVAAAEVEPGDLIVEIGPGPGVLTEALLLKGATVIAIEKDPTLAKALERFQTSDHRLHIIEDDVRNISLDKLLPESKTGRKAKLAANLPYHLTTPILTRFVPRHDLFSSITVMVQHEVAERFSAAPGNKEYGSITVFLRFYAYVEYLFTVGRNCFYPPPKINSAIVRFFLHQGPEGIDASRFFQISRTVFGKRRKTMRSTLTELFPNTVVSKALKQAGILENARPEQLSLEQFTSLYRGFYEEDDTLPNRKSRE